MKDMTDKRRAGECRMAKHQSAPALLTALVVGLIAGWASLAGAEPPPDNPIDYVPPGLVNYQGTLLTEAGGPYTNGVYDIDFRLYPAASGGANTSIWGAGYKVFVRNGVFGVMLGQAGGANLEDHANQYDADELWKAMWFDENDPQTELFLGITVRQDENRNPILPAAIESIPRQQLLVTPFAARAQQAQFARRSAGTFDVAGQLIATNGITAKTADFSEIVTAQTFAGPVKNGQAIGNITMHHTFGGAAPVPAGWMICDGDQVNSVNYNALHGSNAYAADGIATSPLNNKFLPNLVNRYAVGTIDTTATGSGAMPTVGQTNHVVNLIHRHSIPSHIHRIYDYRPGESGAFYNFDGGPLLLKDNDGDGSEEFNLAVEQDGDGVLGLRRDAYTTKDPEHDSGLALSWQQSIQPDSIEVLYIIKVK